MIVNRTPDPDEVYENVRRVWSFAGPLPVPNPKGPTLYCGACGCDTLIVRSWRYFTRGGGATCPYRCDVATKCATCSALTWFGVVVPPDAWSRVPRRFVTLTIKRGEAIREGWTEPFPVCQGCDEPRVPDSVGDAEHAQCEPVGVRS